eukprot:gnl/TRDRNA2_/TRDRNA2_175168_c3_seq1.p1 gnl/TRDRNA2_/TRDRNA2_175168_c3~~gnl/TRDRNA2_/TRDRNA2_175168_c3_seq1.p1  ORF type:complete len:264 (+),score=53.66 gnl/TRDRNA2_/TRDRNA2_175168_c3_seq1:3-794(+)
MQSLFVIMTLAEWDTMANKLSEVVPAGFIWPSFIVYIILVSYSMTALITGCISESLVSARMDDDKLRMQQFEEEKQAMFEGLKRILLMIDEDGNGKISREELLRTLTKETHLLHRLATFDIHLEVDDVLALFDKCLVRQQRLHGRRSVGDSINVEVLIDVLKRTSGPAMAADLLDVKTDVAELKSVMGCMRDDADILARDKTDDMKAMREDLSLLEVKFDGRIDVLTQKVDVMQRKLDGFNQRVVQKFDDLVGALQAGGMLHK